MKISPDDPILTAFVLGELDPSEFAQVEAAVMADPDLQVAVSDLRGLQESLVFELVVEPELELMREQRKEILAIGRAELLAQKKSFEKEAEDALASGILNAMNADSEALAQTSTAGRRIVPPRMIALSGLVAACVALTVSWVASHWKAGGFKDSDVLASHRHEPAVFANSDVEGFNEPKAGSSITELLPSTDSLSTGNSEIASLDSLPQPSVAGDNGTSSADLVEEIPRREDVLLNLNEEVRYGASNGYWEEVSVLPRAPRNSSDLNSRTTETLPEPPDGAENIEKIEARSSESPYKWTREYWTAEIPTEIDTVSYSNVRRYLRQGQIPPQDSVHIEEMINYFDYDLKPSDDGMFGVDVERGICPWEPNHELVRVAVHASSRDGDTAKTPRNFVFLIDSSDSMRNPARLGMLSESAGQLVESLGSKDRVTIFTYEGTSAHLVAGPLAGDRHEALAYAFANLDQSRNMAGTPIRVAFRAARNSLIASGENRVVLITDSNVEAGAGSRETLVELAKLGRECKIGLTVAGVRGGVLDSTLTARLEVEADVETHYLDGAGDAVRFFGKVLAKPAKVLADRVSINVEFESSIVRSFRLIGFANRSPVDSYDRRATPSNVRDGYALTALYEIIPMAAPVELNEMGDHESWAERENDRALASSLVDGGVPLMEINLRYAPVGAKLPKQTILKVANEKVTELAELSPDFQFAAAVAGYGMMLRESPYRGDVSTTMVRQLAEGGLAFDPYGLRREFVELVRLSEKIRR
ncbi:MAG: von Willebrand factor type A domain-containing protein [Verrucomicrobiae bacterium]|nr:von Willebrand factor type A domain-containing protein [Verrucomicrobiae bacterium]